MTSYPTKWSLPALGVDPDLVITCGISSGGYTSSQLHIVWSNVIKGAGLIISGPYMALTTMWRMKSLSWRPQDRNDNLEKIQKLYEEVWGKTQAFEKAGKIDPLSNIKNSPVMVHNGAVDVLNRPEAADFTKLFYGGLDANLQITMEPGMAHDFPKDEPRTMLKYLYDNLPKTKGQTWNDPVSTNGLDFAKQGYLRKFDQQEFIEEAAKDYKAIPGNEDQTIDFQFHQIMRWGYVYYPKICLTEACKFSLVIHGCAGNAFGHIEHWGQQASNNKLALVFPQGAMCWDVSEPKHSNGTFTKQGFMELFFKKIIDRVTSPVSNKYNNEFENEYSSDQTYRWDLMTEKPTEALPHMDRTGYETEICYSWYDESQNLDKHCYVEEGSLYRYEEDLPWDMKFASNDVTIDQAKLFISALLNGLTQRGQTEYMQSCIELSHPVAEGVSRIRDYLKSDDITEMIKGVKIFNDLAGILPQLLGNCGELEGPEVDADRFQSWLSVFESDSEFLATVYRNITPRYNEIESVIQAFITYVDHEMFEQAGNAYSAILKNVIGDFPSLQTYLI